MRASLAHINLPGQLLLDVRIKKFYDQASCHMRFVRFFDHKIRGGGAQPIAATLFMLTIMGLSVSEQETPTKHDCVESPSGT